MAFERVFWKAGVKSECLQCGRYLPFVVKPETESISTKRSLVVLVQIRDLCIGKSRKQTFAGENQSLTLVVNIAAIVDIERAPDQTGANVSINSGQIRGFIVKGNSCSEEATS